LIEQGIIKEVKYDRSKRYEYQYNAPELDTEAFEILRKAKLKDLDNMIDYVNLNDCRMKFLCDFLGDTLEHDCGKCDNDIKKQTTVNATDEWKSKLEKFRESYFPELIVESKKSNIVNGIAASYYGVSNVGSAIHRSKYENGGDFPDFLLKLFLKAFRKKYGQEKFDLIVYIPPTESGDLVKTFAMKVSQVLKFPISHKLVKKRETKPQKVFQNSYLKADNVSGAFSYNALAEIKGKSVLLIDDIFDSGATMKELGKLFTNLGAVIIAPVVIAKTVGGDV